MVFITISRETTEEYTSKRMKTIPEGRSEKQERTVKRKVNVWVNLDKYLLYKITF